MASRPNPWRVKHIQYSLRRESDQLPTVRDLMHMSRAEMYAGDAGLKYAMAWSLVYFMLEDTRSGYRKVLVRYFSLLRKGESRADAYKKSFGKVPMDRFEERWKKFTLRL